MERLDYILDVMKERTEVFNARHFCFKEQVDFVFDKSKFKTAVCSRRAGKTVSLAAYLIRAAIDNPGAAALYITLSRSNAKKIIWGDLLNINREFGLGGRADQTELSLKIPGAGPIYLSGAKDKSEIEKFRGLPLSLAVIDEAQSFRGYIEELIDDVLSKAIFDYDGTICVVGTPSPVPAGFFYNCAHSDEWSHHAWTMLQNPFLEKKSGRKPIELIEQDCKRMGVGLDHPKIQRECFGRWVVDTSHLVFAYALANDFRSSETNNFVVGVDLGFDDADAIAVIGWKSHDSVSYLVEEIVKPKQGITELAGTLSTLIAKYNPLSVVMDTGGLGKKIAEEIRRRFALPIRPAEKVRKFEYIELLNDALRTRRFYAKKDGHFAQDALLIEWDKDRSNGDKKVISDAFHSDIADAVLYGFRESLHWLEEPKKESPTYGSEQWNKEQEEKLIAEMEKALQRDQDDPANWQVSDQWGTASNW